MTDETLKEVLVEASASVAASIVEERLDGIVSSAVDKALASFSHKLPCGLKPEAATELVHLMAMLKDTSGGGAGSEGYAKGVENLRTHLCFVSSWRGVCMRVGQITLSLVVIGLGGWLIWLFSSGFRSWLKGVS